MTLFKLTDKLAMRENMPTAKTKAMTKIPIEFSDII